MLRARLAYRLVLLLLVAFYPAFAFALNETYEGALQPDNRDPPIPIVVELRDQSGSLKGSVKTSHPYKGNATIESALHLQGQCTVNVSISKSVTLRLDGNCEPSSYNGTYTLRDTQRRTVTPGKFRLDRKASDSAKEDSPRRSVASASTPASCLKHNTQCLAACPRGDANVEFMCSNHCRTKLRNCKATAKKPGVEPE